MRLVTAITILAASSPALAAAPSAPRFEVSWKSLPTTHFSRGDASAVRVAAAHPSPVAPSLVSDALASAREPEQRRDLVINEIAAGWEPAQRAALEDLRDAQRAYARVAVGDGDARGQRFVALIKRVVDGSGRSAARDPSTTGDGVALNKIYDRILREAPDDRLQAIEATENSWTAYRDAFDRFALIMDRPDAAVAIDKDLASLRAEELQADANSEKAR